MKTKTLLLCCLVVMIALVASADQRTYEKPIESVWDAAVKTIRDVDFVLMDSDREEHEFLMRTKSWHSHKKGNGMRVELVANSQSSTTITVKAADPAKAKKLAKHIAAYLTALDERLD